MNVGASPVRTILSSSHTLGCMARYQAAARVVVVVEIALLFLEWGIDQ